MKLIQLLLLLTAVVFAIVCSGPNKSTVGPAPGEPWLALHILGYDTDNEIDELSHIIPSLAEMGINTLIFEVDYNFDFKSHPELKRGNNPGISVSGTPILGKGNVPAAYCLSSLRFNSRRFSRQ